jgi:hypothetical protein
VNLRVIRTYGDVVETVEAGHEKSVGRRVGMCPWASVRDPFVQHVMSAWAWWQKGQLEAKYGGDPPEAIVRGVSIFDSAINRIKSHDTRDDAEKRRREIESRKAETQTIRVQRRR